MLIEFRVENHRSIRDEQVLSLEAGRVGPEDDPRPRTIRGYSEKILPVVVLYGANASGKSNVLSAIAYMKEAVLLSQRFWSPDEGTSRHPFAWGPKRNEPSFFEVVIVLDNVRYQYGFTLDDETFLEEWLYAWPNGKKQVWFSREGEVFNFGDNLKGENKVIEEVTRRNALFLSAAAQLKHPQLSPIYSWFGSIETVNLTTPFFPGHIAYHPILASLLDGSSEPRQLSMFEDGETPERLAARFKTLLKSADFGIVDARAIKKESAPASRQRAVRFEFKHQSESDDAWLPLEEESRGTQTLFRLALPILSAIQSGRVLVADELESSMHPNLAEQIVLQFNDPKLNPHNAQLVFSTHDTNLLGNLLGEPALRRDQVWLTEKDSKGATALYPLTDYKPRNDENIERGYVQGRYGAIPFLGGFKLPLE